MKRERERESVCWERTGQEKQFVFFLIGERASALQINHKIFVAYFIPFKIFDTGNTKEDVMENNFRMCSVIT